jgi:ribose transport system substrate-binding protein
LKVIHAGAIQATQELAQQGDTISIIWKGPLREDDREQQVQVVEGFLSQGVQGIVLAPLDSRALVRPVEEAKGAGIPTVIIDSGLQSDIMVSFVATDNRKGGALAAQRMGEVLGGKGKVLMLRYQEGSASTQEREAGFLETIRGTYPGIQVVSSDQYAGPTRTAKRAAESPEPLRGQLQGIFLTVIDYQQPLAPQDMGSANKIKLVGFDESDPTDALRNGQLRGSWCRTHAQGPWA